MKFGMIIHKGCPKRTGTFFDNKKNKQVLINKSHRNVQCIPHQLYALLPSVWKPVYPCGE